MRPQRPMMADPIYERRANILNARKREAESKLSDTTLFAALRKKAQKATSDEPEVICQKVVKHKRSTDPDVIEIYPEDQPRPNYQERVPKVPSPPEERFENYEKISRSGPASESKDRDYRIESAHDVFLEGPFAEPSKSNNYNDTLPIKGPRTPEPIDPGMPIAVIDPMTERLRKTSESYKSEEYSSNHCDIKGENSYGSCDKTDSASVKNSVKPRTNLVKDINTSPNKLNTFFEDKPEAALAVANLLAGTATLLAGTKETPKKETPKKEIPKKEPVVTKTKNSNVSSQSLTQLPMPNTLSFDDDHSSPSPYTPPDETVKLPPKKPPKVKEIKDNYRKNFSISRDLPMPPGKVMAYKRLNFKAIVISSIAGSRFLNGGFPLSVSSLSQKSLTSVVQKKSCT